MLWRRVTDMVIQPQTTAELAEIYTHAFDRLCIVLLLFVCLIACLLTCLLAFILLTETRMLQSAYRLMCASWLLLLLLFALLLIPIST